MKKNIIQWILDKKYKEINPYKRRSKPKKGNLEPKKIRVAHYN